MQFSSGTEKSNFDYVMKGECLSTVHHHPYLRVELSDNQKYNLHIDSIVKKASSVLGFLKRNLRYCQSKVKENLKQT